MRDQMAWAGAKWASVLAGAFLLLTSFLFPRTPAGAFIAWARLPAGLEADAFVERLRREHDTLVVPGDFFGRPDHVRIGFGGRRERLEEGLRRLALALRG